MSNRSILKLVAATVPIMGLFVFSTTDASAASGCHRSYAPTARQAAPPVVPSTANRRYSYEPATAYRSAPRPMMRGSASISTTQRRLRPGSSR